MAESDSADDPVAQLLKEYRDLSTAVCELVNSFTEIQDVDWNISMEHTPDPSDPTDDCWIFEVTDEVTDTDESAGPFLVKALRDGSQLWLFEEVASMS